ncbi:DUF3780 domain-containing protein [Methylobacterium gossipiicola]|uniref:DUF3780 domain-containing protein n=1 Tax=Methylobacterium gossipiicola TaxID=582675 RepID=A0A1I2T2A7_9HYPH|nr:DUF3780 domain-containing protein [Methylobacterium gossipiicola]SFG58279.1 Protein of unknown function [Methylobacterium gossipiicola]
MSGFDCADHYQEHCYLVQVPRTAKESVHVFEVYGRPPKATEDLWAPEVTLRAQLTKGKWDAISAEVRLEFNRRLKLERRKAGTWSQGGNGVQRLLGKELLVLVWAVEQDVVSLEQCEVAVRNWLGLKPEERWWLYTMTAAATGFAHQVGMGWRDALTKALCFGTRRDVFSLGSVTGRGTLPPRRNDAYAPVKDASRKRIEFAALRAIAANVEVLA